MGYWCKLCYVIYAIRQSQIKLSKFHHVVLTYKENETTALILASHCEFGTRNRIGGTKLEELYVFLNKFGDETLSNCYVEDIAKESKIAEYSNVDGII